MHHETAWLFAQCPRKPYCNSQPPHGVRQCIDQDAGVLFQLNVNSLTGYYGTASKKIAERLIDENMIDFIGSDLHGGRHMDSLNRVMNERYFRKLMAQGVKNSLLI